MYRFQWYPFSCSASLTCKLLGVICNFLNVFNWNFTCHICRGCRRGHWLGAPGTTVCMEWEPITGVCGQSPQRGPGAEPHVMGQIPCSWKPWSNHTPKGMPKTWCQNANTIYRYMYIHIYLRQIDIFYLPYELAIVILHTAEKKAVASHHAERTPSGPPSGVQA